jgi:hypothetical protein
MDPWTTPWGMPWGMPIQWSLVGIAVFAIIMTSVLFGAIFWYAQDKIDISVRTGRR